MCPGAVAPTNVESVKTMTKIDPKTIRPTVIASRKSCDAEGTGLSHYVLMDKQVKR